GLAVNKSNWANTIDAPPFEGYAVTCGLTFTFGGVRITTDAEVLNTDYQPIRGLYAAGELVGGLFYFNYPGGSGLTPGAVVGRTAGTAAARAGKNWARHGIRQFIRSAAAAGRGLEGAARHRTHRAVHAGRRADRGRRPEHLQGQDRRAARAGGLDLC